MATQTTKPPTAKELETKLTAQAEEANGPRKLNSLDKQMIENITNAYRYVLDEGRKENWPLGKAKSEFAHVVNMAAEDMGSTGASSTLSQVAQSKLETTARQAIDVAFIPK